MDTVIDIKKNKEDEETGNRQETSGGNTNEYHILRQVLYK